MGTLWLSQAGKPSLLRLQLQLRLLRLLCLLCLLCLFRRRPCRSWRENLTRPVERTLARTSRCGVAAVCASCVVSRGQRTAAV